MTNDTSLSAADIAHLRKLEEMLWRAETRLDTDLMGSLFAPDLIEFGRSGQRYDRADLLLTRSLPHDFSATLPLPQFDARALSETVALVTYVSEIKLGDGVEHTNRASVWTRWTTSWKLQFHQGTPTD